jgi:phosphonoacetate hydrolase
VPSVWSIEPLTCGDPIPVAYCRAVPDALAAADAETKAAAIEVLIDATLDPIVDAVAWQLDAHHFDVASSDGHVRVARIPEGQTETGAPRWRYEADVLAGADPIARQDPAFLVGLDAERSHPHPVRADNSYPYGYDHLAQVFDHPDAPDLIVLHTASHYWGDQGGHLGEHGSLGVTQARAPFIASGAGVERRGLVAQGCRLVDVASCVLELLAGDQQPWSSWLRGGDGELPEGVVAEPGGATHVVAFLLDGANPNVLYDLAASGRAPNLAGLIDAGTAFAHGAIASLPTVTLANHTAILTGRHPGHHGILHNAWVNRATGAQVVTNSPATWTTATAWLAPNVETVHHVVKRALPGATTISCNEPCDAGADHSVFEQLRRGEEVDRPPSVDALPDATERFVRPVKDYRWGSRADHLAVAQFSQLWSGSYRGRSWDLPAFSWVNFTLTDAAFHEGGPYSEIAAASVADTDARIGRILDAVDAAGAADDTAFLVVADHGMQLADPAVTGDWDVALRAAGIPARDEGYGFVYLT